MYIYICVCIYIYMYIYITIFMYVYIYAHPPPGPTFFPITLTVSLRGQPSAICYLPKKTMHWRAFSPSPSQSRSPKTLFLCVCFFLFLVFLPCQSPTQNKSSKILVCLFVLVWGRAGELIIVQKYMHRYLGGLSTLNLISIGLERLVANFGVCEETILLFPCDCVAVLPNFIEKSKPLLLEREGSPLIC